MEIKETIKSQFGHHGEVQFFRASEIAEGFKKADKQVLSKGSRGGNHSLVGDYDFYTSEKYPSKYYVKVNKPSTVVHHDGEVNLDQLSSSFTPKNHKNGILPEGLFFVTKQHKLDIINKIMVENLD